MKYFNGDWFADLYTLENILDEIEFYSGSERRKMLTHNGHKKTKENNSMLYGLTWRGYLTKTSTRTKCEKTGLYKTKVMDLYPELEDIFNEFSKFHFPNFEFHSVMMNKSFICPPHRDSKNIGESILVCCGDYQGGKTAVDIDGKIHKFDPRIAPVKFNGSKYLHWTEPFEGKRYSLVFFTNFRNIYK